MKIYAMEFTSNVAVAINGNKRQNFEAGDKVIVSRSEYLSLLRLGATLISEKKLAYSDVFKKAEKVEKQSKE